MISTTEIDPNSVDVKKASQVDHFCRKLSFREYAHDTHTHTHTQRTDCSAWTTEVVDNNAVQFETVIVVVAAASGATTSAAAAAAAADNDDVTGKNHRSSRTTEKDHQLE